MKYRQWPYQPCSYSTSPICERDTPWKHGGAALKGTVDLGTRTRWWKSFVTVMRNFLLFPSALSPEASSLLAEAALMQKSPKTFFLEWCKSKWNNLKLLLEQLDNKGRGEKNQVKILAVCLHVGAVGVSLKFGFPVKFVPFFLQPSREVLPPLAKTRPCLEECRECRLRAAGMMRHVDRERKKKRSDLTCSIMRFGDTRAMTSRTTARQCGKLQEGDRKWKRLPVYK